MKQTSTHDWTNVARLALAAVVTLTLAACEMTPGARPPGNGEAVVILPRVRTVEPFAILDVPPVTISELGRSRRFLIGTAGRDSIRILDDEGSIASFHEFSGEPRPTASAWWSDRYTMGFATHGRVLTGNLAGLLQYTDTDAEATIAMAVNRQGELLLLTRYPSDNPDRSHALLMMDGERVRRHVRLFFEPRGLVAEANGEVLISDGDSIYRVTSAGNISRAVRGLEDAGPMVRLDGTTLLVGEHESRRPYPGRVVAIDTLLGRRTVILDGLTRITSLLVASDGSVWLTESGDEAAPAAAIYRLSREDVASVRRGQVAHTVPRDAARTLMAE